MNRDAIPARLFTISAAAFAGLGLLELAGRKPALDVYIYDGYFVLSHPHVALAASGICGLFAAMHFGIARMLPVPMNRGLSLANFLLTAVPTAVLVLAIYDIRPGTDVQSSLSFMKLLEILFVSWAVCFLIGSVLFALNFGSAIFRSFLTRRKA